MDREMLGRSIGAFAMNQARKIERRRTITETDIYIQVNLDGEGQSEENGH